MTWDSDEQDHAVRYLSVLRYLTLSLASGGPNPSPRKGPKVKCKGTLRPIGGFAKSLCNGTSRNFKKKPCI